MPQSSVANRKHHHLHLSTPTTSLATTTKMPATAPADDDEDDYLSEKFLTVAAASASASSSTATTYYERRRQANRDSAIKVEMNNRKNRSRKDLEEESRRQGLQKSLFDRAREEDEARAVLTTPTPPLGSTAKSTANIARTNTNAGTGAGGADSENEESSYALVKDPPPLMTSNKALGMMLKMGFKEGQPLGRQHSAGPSDSHSDDGKPSPSPSSTDSLLGASTSNAPSKPRSPVIPARVTSPKLPTSSKPLIEPLPVDIWEGRKGIGLGKRSFKPDSDSLVSGRAPKLAKVDDDDPRSRLDDEAFRNRAREEYEERRASGNLANARRALIALDEKKGVKFDILWIDPHNTSTVPKELQMRLQWMADEDDDPRFLHGHDKSVNEANRSEAEKLRERMIADALRPARPLDDLAPEPGRPRPRPPEEKKQPPKDFDIEVDDDMLEDTKIFLTLNARTRLRYTLEYLRTQHLHCFWCGTSYCSEQALKEKCPGEDETDHD